MIGFTNPLFLLFVIPFVLLFIWLIRKKAKSYLVHPWTAHLSARIGSGKFRSLIIPIALLLIGLGLCMIIANPWFGSRETQQKTKNRMIGLVIDVSGSMMGAPLEAATNVAKHLITKRPDDRINICYFAGEAVPTAFGITASYLTKERVLKQANNLGGSTVASHGLFAEFVAIAREDGLMTENELGDIFARVSTTGPMKDKTPAARQHQFKNYLNSVLKVKPVKKTDRMVIFISDCDLDYSSYDFASVMELYTTYDIKLSVICITGNKTILTKPEDKTFVSAINHGINKNNIRIIDDSQLKENSQKLSNNLTNVVEKIEKMNPREIDTAATIEKQSISKYFFIVIIGIFLSTRILALYLIKDIQA